MASIVLLAGAALQIEHLARDPEAYAEEACQDSLDGATNPSRLCWEENFNKSPYKAAPVPLLGGTALGLAAIAVILRSGDRKVRRGVLLIVAGVLLAVAVLYVHLVSGGRY